MKFMFVCPTQPIANGAGIQKRAWSHLEALSRHGEVVVVLVLTDGQIARLEPLDDIRARSHSLHIIPLDQTSRARVSGIPGFTALKRWLTRGHPMLAPRENAETSAMRDCVRSRSYDLLFCFRLRAFSLLDPVFGRAFTGNHKVFVDFDDIESVASQRELENQGDAVGFEQRLLMNIELAETFALEQCALRDAAGVSVCSTLDAERLRKVGSNAKVCVVPNALPKMEMLSTHPMKQEVNILFVGTMTYQPNEDAVVFFCREIVPLIKARSKRPLNIQIVGRGPSAIVRALAADAAVTVIGGVDSVEPCYERADIVVAPIRFGGGTRIKILEALALGRPVVSTRIGAEGLDLLADRDILIADSPADFANACVRLAENATLRCQLAQAGRKRFETLYEARSVQAKMLGELQAIIDRNPHHIDP